MTANQLRVRFASDESITDLRIDAEYEDTQAACDSYRDLWDELDELWCAFCRTEDVR